MPDTNLAQAIERLERRSGILHKRLLKLPSAKKFFSRSTLLAHNLRQKSGQLLAGAGLVGAIITMPAPRSLSEVGPAPQELSEPSSLLTGRQKLRGNLPDLLSHNPGKLTPETAQKVEQLIYDSTKIRTKAVLEGQSLNHQVGYIGFEQHLKRFPGDSLANHDEIQEAGMAPGLGAFGYFARDSQSFTTRDFQREKYYCVVQTLYLENWNRDNRYLKDWYKFRKMLIINPLNGLATVCVIGDAGPAEWTGKQFGGSPETMQALDLNKGPRKGLVLMLFIDDPNNEVPLGPVNY